MKRLLELVICLAIVGCEKPLTDEEVNSVFRSGGRQVADTCFLPKERGGDTTPEYIIPFDFDVTPDGRMQVTHLASADGAVLPLRISECVRSTLPEVYRFPDSSKGRGGLRRVVVLNEKPEVPNLTW